jgi:hypothetical protein
VGGSRRREQKEYAPMWQEMETASFSTWKRKTKFELKKKEMPLQIIIGSELSKNP